MRKQAIRKKQLSADPLPYHRFGKLIEAYKKVNTGAEIELQTTDSTTGKTSAIDGVMISEWHHVNYRMKKKINWTAR